MYASDSQHDQIYRMWSCLIIIIDAFSPLNAKIISSRKKKDTSDGIRQDYKLRKRLFGRKFWMSNIFLNNYWKPPELVNC